MCICDVESFSGALEQLQESFSDIGIGMRQDFQKLEFLMSELLLKEI